MKIPYWQVDAFANRPGTGNPAGVCLLTSWLPDEAMQLIAFENNHSETAFVVKEALGWKIRWFSPTVEVDLCGHATLAAAAVLFSEGKVDSRKLMFASRSGPLRVQRDGDILNLDFPAGSPLECSPPEGLSAALGVSPRQVLLGRYLTVVLKDEETVRQLTPDLNALARIDVFAVIVTAPGRACDYVLRVFGPRAGIPEDPVTGSAQCDLVPYWADILGKKELLARQLSARGGELRCQEKGKRVRIGGRAVVYLKGEIDLG